MTFLSETMAMELKIQHLINDEGCYRVVRELRWISGIACLHCEAKNIIQAEVVTTRFGAASAMNVHRSGIDLI
ncbi:hypothetical protein [Candidatus Williamhamiltonella defendens]|uniref:hypothetical protein n=1 Tax=Candidatus Williamhamiltonella defendens TaxID=138072 RepID=UPI00130EAF82|nr:hypothetical protein [Candidatus Hamiltonella defensa]